MAKRDYYEVLGVERTADEAAIKAAYRKLAKKLHPDVNPGDKDAEEKFKEVNEAYQVLSDPQKRAQYDRFGHQQPGAGGAGGYGDFSGFGGFGGFDVEDIFSSFFGGGFGGSRARREQGPVPGADLRYDIAISFEEAAKGCEKEINLVRDETCENCKGTGQIISDPCPKCNGRGKVRTSKRRTVRIPAGIDNGQIVTIRGQGEPGERGGEAGDLLIVVTVRPHRLFQRNGTDLYLEMPLTFTQAALGCEADVPTLEKPVKYRFPEGTQPGQTFRIRGQGIPSLRGNGRGDLYVTCLLYTSPAQGDKIKLHGLSSCI